MPELFDDLAPCAALAQIAKDFHTRGWMAGTAGNLSARIDETSFWITASGMPKGRLNEGDFLRIDLDGNMIETKREQNKPSAETSIHQVIYRLFPGARACFHVHSVDAVVATRKHAGDADKLRLPAIEMLKGFDIWQQDPQIDLPVFDNILEVPRIAAEIEQRLQASPPDLDALMIRDHGITVWGDSLQQAYNRVEILEFLMSVAAK